MGEVSTIGLDIAKSVLQVHGVDGAGAVVMRKRISRAKMLSARASACGSAPISATSNSRRRRLGIRSDRHLLTRRVQGARSTLAPHKQSASLKSGDKMRVISAFHRSSFEVEAKTIVGDRRTFISFESAKGLDTRGLTLKILTSSLRVEVDHANRPVLRHGAQPCRCALHMSAFDPKRTSRHGAKARIYIGLSIVVNRLNCEGNHAHQACASI